MPLPGLKIALSLVLYKPKNRLMVGADEDLLFGKNRRKHRLIVGFINGTIQ